MVSEVALKLFFFGIIGLAVALEIIGDVYFKKYSIDNKYSFLIIGLMIYFIGSVFWAVSLKYEMMSKAIVVFAVLNILVVALIGMVFFKEELTLMNKIGIFVGLISVVLIEL